MKVTTDQTCDFAEVWRYNGILVQQSPANIQFACDWANICMASLIEELQARAKAKKEAVATPKPSIVLTGADS